VRGRLGGRLGVVLALAGFVVIYLGYNGAASFDDLRQQFPYLLSGGVAGLALVVVGCALMAIDVSRAESEELRASIDALRSTLERQSSPRPATRSVVVGAASFHEPTCRTVAGRTDLEQVDRAEAEARGLSPCRACQPA
jgi:uncharacterized membrane protein